MKNQIKEINYNGIIIKAGLGATEWVGCNKYARVVIEIVNEKTIKVSKIKAEDYDKIKKINNIDMLPIEYIDKYNKEVDCYNDSPIIYTLRKNNIWREKGLSINKNYGVHLELGKIDSYVDYGC